MKMTSKILAVIVLILIFGGIMLSDRLGMWQTVSSKQVAVISEGNFADMPDPADIRGSYSLSDIEANFGIPSSVLAEAFNVPSEQADSFTVKALENTDVESGVEVGTASVRLFVAFYTGLPIDLTGEESFLPESAVAILRSKNLTAEQAAYLDNHTLENTAAENADSATPTAEMTESGVDVDYLVKGKTTFADLLNWGVPRDAIEEVLGMPLPEDTQNTIKDFAASNDLDFETIKTNLQVKVDEAR